MAVRTKKVTSEIKTFSYDTFYFKEVRNLKLIRQLTSKSEKKQNSPLKSDSMASLSVLSPCSMDASSASSCSKAQSSATLALAASVSSGLPAAALSNHLRCE